MLLNKSHPQYIIHTCTCIATGTHCEHSVALHNSVVEAHVYNYVPVVLSIFCSPPVWVGSPTLPEGTLHRLPGTLSTHWLSRALSLQPLLDYATTAWNSKKTHEQCIHVLYNYTRFADNTKKGTKLKRNISLKETGPELHALYKTGDYLNNYNCVHVV